MDVSGRAGPFGPPLVASHCLHAVRAQRATTQKSLRRQLLQKSEPSRSLLGPIRRNKVCSSHPRLPGPVGVVSSTRPQKGRNHPNGCRYLLRYISRTADSRPCPFKHRIFTTNHSPVQSAPLHRSPMSHGQLNCFLFFGPTAGAAAAP